MATKQIFFRVISLIFSAIILAACGGGTSGSDAGTATSPTANTTTVEPLNPDAGSNWNDYVSAADGTSCDPQNDNDCTNGGLQRVIYVANQTDCTGVTASDNLGVFDWSCEVSGGQARMVSTGFKTTLSGEHKGISDLIDFNTGVWKTMTLEINRNGGSYTTSAAQWWTNKINMINGPVGGMTSGEVYIVTQGNHVEYFVPSEVILLIDSNANFNGKISTVQGSSFVWIEGTIDAATFDNGVYLSNTKHSTLNGVTVLNADTGGIQLDNSDYNTLVDISSVAALATTGYGVYLYSSSHNTLNNVTVKDYHFNSNSIGVYLYGSDNNKLSIIDASNNSTGLSLSSFSDGNILASVSTTLNGEFGIVIQSSSNNLLTDVLATDCITPVLLSSAKNNTFAGQLWVGGGDPGNCSVTGSSEIEAPGLIDLSCSETGVNGSYTYGQYNLSTAKLTNM